MEKPFQVAISYDKDIPDEIISAFVSDISAQELDIRSEPRDSAVYAGVEWYIPTALMIFIGKAYFDSFLKEMGKEHYHLLKKGIISLWKHFFGHDRTVKLKRVATNGKVSDVPEYSRASSLMTDLPGQFRIKYLLKDELSEAAFIQAIEHFFNFLEQLSTGVLNPEISQQLQNARGGGHTILLTYDGNIKILNALPEKNTTRSK
ncbi:MAG: hypothetical protein ABSA46_14420 [Thermodesulfovibrionales bacterium]|jgi:hypothetical protein